MEYFAMKLQPPVNNSSIIKSAIAEIKEEKFELFLFFLPFLLFTYKLLFNL